MTIRRGARLVLALLAAGAGGRAEAFPTYSGNCGLCHMTRVDNAAVTGNSGTLNPAGGSGALKSFDVNAGASVTISLSVPTAFGDTFAAAVVNLNAPGLGRWSLPYTPDAAWNAGTDYYYTPFLTEPGVLKFTLNVGAGAYSDVYTLSFNEAGGAEAWYDLEPFYLNVHGAAPPHPGDANHDGQVDLQDFGALKDHFGITTPATWEDGDFTHDLYVDLQDFGVLKDHFGHTAGAPLQAVPEPGLAILLLLGLPAAMRRARRP